MAGYTKKRSLRGFNSTRQSKAEREMKAANKKEGSREKKYDKSE